jgi:hypothetical protein
MPFIVVIKGKKQEEYEDFHSKAKARAWANKMGIKRYDVVFVEFEPTPEPTVPVSQAIVHRPLVCQPQVVQSFIAPVTQPQIILLKMKKPRKHKKSNNPGYDRWGRNPKNLKMRRPYQGGLPGQSKNA